MITLIFFFKKKKAWTEKIFFFNSLRLPYPTLFILIILRNFGFQIAREGKLKLALKNSWDETMESNTIAVERRGGVPLPNKSRCALLVQYDATQCGISQECVRFHWCFVPCMSLFALNKIFYMLSVIQCDFFNLGRMRKSLFFVKTTAKCFFWNHFLRMLCIT